MFIFRLTVTFSKSPPLPPTGEAPFFPFGLLRLPALHPRRPTEQDAERYGICSQGSVEDVSSPFRPCRRYPWASLGALFSPLLPLFAHLHLGSSLQAFAQSARHAGHVVWVLPFPLLSENLKPFRPPALARGRCALTRQQPLALTEWIIFPLSEHHSAQRPTRQRCAFRPQGGCPPTPHHPLRVDPMVSVRHPRAYKALPGPYISVPPHRHHPPPRASTPLPPLPQGREDDEGGPRRHLQPRSPIHRRGPCVSPHPPTASLPSYRFLSVTPEALHIPNPHTPKLTPDATPSDGNY